MRTAAVAQRAGKRAGADGPAVTGAPVPAPRTRSRLALSPQSALALQRSAGNSAVTRHLMVQRCGAVPPDQCPCHDNDASSPAPVQRLSGTPVVQRDDAPPTPETAPAPVSTAGPGDTHQVGDLAALKPLVDDAIAAVGPAATTVVPVPEQPGNDAPADLQATPESAATTGRPVGLSAQRLPDGTVVQRDGKSSSTPYHPEGGLVGSVQFCYDWMTGDLSLTGWLWAGVGYKTPFGWYGAYTFAEASWNVGNIGPLLTPGTCAVADAPHGAVAAHAGAGVALFPVIITPGERARFSKGGLEIGLLITLHPSTRSADLEVIGLLDVKKYLGPFGAAATAVEAAARRLGEEFGQRVECGAGFDLSLSAHLCQAADPNAGILGYTANSLKLCGGGYIGCNINLSRNRSSLPGGGH